jgi:hypothetical protein
VSTEPPGRSAASRARDGWTLLGTAAPVWRATERAAQPLGSNKRAWRLEHAGPVRCADWRGHLGGQDCPAASD